MWNKCESMDTWTLWLVAVVISAFYVNHQALKFISACFKTYWLIKTRKWLYVFRLDIVWNGHQINPRDFTRAMTCVSYFKWLMCPKTCSLCATCVSHILCVLTSIIHVAHIKMCLIICSIKTSMQFSDKTRHKPVKHALLKLVSS